MSQRGKIRNGRGFDGCKRTSLEVESIAFSRIYREIEHVKGQFPF